MENETKKKKGGKAKWIVLAVVLVIIIGAVAGGGSDKPKKVADTGSDTTKSETKEAASEKDDTSDQADSEETETQTEEKDTFGIGEVAEMNDIQVTMVNYTESEGSEYNKPSDGNEFVLVEFEIANNSDSEMTVSSMASFEAYADDYALNYSLNAAVDNPDANQLDGTIAAGKKMNGVIGYEVPKDWKNLEIHFTDNVWSSNKFKFEITR
ncbi:MAG: DUF5067 domain-containing protein [Lachnospiraceae bacterium]|nr:DUF5067 domain-containing protein [Lachnospiraceae bacterium]